MRSWDFKGLQSKLPWETKRKWREASADMNGKNPIQKMKMNS